MIASRERPGSLARARARGVASAWLVVALASCWRNSSATAPPSSAPATTPRVARADARPIDPFDELIDALERFTDDMCACSDPACAQQVSEELTRWSRDMTRRSQEPLKMSEQDQKRSAEIGERMGHCMQKAMMGSGVTAPVGP